MQKNYIKEIGADGIENIDHEEIKTQRIMVTKMIKIIGTQIIQGKPLIDITFPIEHDDPRTILEAFSCCFTLSPYFLDNLINVSNKIERIKLVNKLSNNI